MNINYFREFLTLAELKNYSLAADNLYMNQSTLSKHIKAMEEEFRCPLFERTSRRVELTEFGEKMLPIAEKISVLQYEYETLTYHYLKGTDTVLEIASIPAIPYYGITDLLVNFQKKFPNIQINIQEADSLILRKWLEEKRCEIAFLRDSSLYTHSVLKQEIELEKIPYSKDRLVAVLPNTHSLSKRKFIELSELEHEKFALIKQSTMPYNFCMQLCERSGFIPNVVFTSHNIETILDFIVKSDSVSLLFFNHIQYFNHLPYTEYLTVIPICPEVYTEICISYKKDGSLSKAAMEFLKYIKRDL